MAVLFGSSAGFHDPASVFLVSAIIFLSVLAHELGHAFTGRAFGLEPAIMLHGMGGVTTWTRGRRIDAGRSLVISVAGPAVGFMIGLGLILVGRFLVPAVAPDYHAPHTAVALFQAAIWTNLAWSIFNLAPVMPLDGGNAFRSFWALTTIGDAELVARGVSIGAGGVFAAVLFTWGWWWGAFLMGAFAIQNIRGFRQRLLSRGDEKVERDLATAYEVWFVERDGDAMVREGTRVRAQAKTDQLVARAIEVVAMGQCLQGDARSALATLKTIPRGYVPSLDAMLYILEQAGEHETALEVLRRAAESSQDPQLLRRFEEARARMS
jgi:Zn-dependent protease